MTVTQTNYKRIIVKIGSNVLTRPDGTLNITRMSGLVDQVAELHNRGLEVVMVSSGAMAAGRGLMRGTIKGNLDPVSARQLYSSVGQAKLINRYFDFFCDHGITCGQILTTKESLATRGHYLNQKHCMEVMLDHGVIPIVNENDTISVTELMFTDNDELSGMVAAMMGAQALVILSNVDGVYDKDPNKYADAVKYDTLSHTEVLAKGLAVMDSTAASLCRDNHIPILVFNLSDPENIVRAAKGENIGTVVK